MDLVDRDSSQWNLSDEEVDQWNLSDGEHLQGKLNVHVWSTFQIVMYVADASQNVIAPIATTVEPDTSLYRTLHQVLKVSTIEGFLKLGHLSI